MRLIKMLGLASIAALAVLALAGVGTASADRVCLKHEAGCTNYEGPILGLAPVAKLTAGTFVEECHSEFLAENQKEEANTALLYLIHSLVFDNCKGNCPTVKTENLPYLALADAAAEHVIVKKHLKGAGNPAALLEGCKISIFTVNCLYEAAEVLLRATLKTDLMKAENVPLIRGGDSGVCPEKATWNAEYLVTEDLVAGNPPLFLVNT